MLGKMIDKTRVVAPLVHCITNYVTVNDCANILLACGGSPIMADAAGEVSDITSICSALDINIGTLNERTIESMVIAGQRSNELSHPVLLDPVGAGASALRTKTAFELLEKVKFTVIRGNISEIKTIYKGFGTTKGVDADANDAVTGAIIADVADIAMELATRKGAIIAITGEIDIIANSDRAYAIRNGHAMMSKITGTGCMLSALICALVAANPQWELEATVAAVCLMGICGEKAAAAATGTASFRIALIDAMSNMDGTEFNKMAKWEEIK